MLQLVNLEGIRVRKRPNVKAYAVWGWRRVKAPETPFGKEKPMRTSTRPSREEEERNRRRVPESPQTSEVRSCKSPPTCTQRQHSSENSPLNRRQIKFGIFQSTFIECKRSRRMRTFVQNTTWVSLKSSTAKCCKKQSFKVKL